MCITGNTRTRQLKEKVSSSRGRRGRKPERETQELRATWLVAGESPECKTLMANGSSGPVKTYRKKFDLEPEPKESPEGNTTEGTPWFPSTLKGDPEKLKVERPGRRA